MPLDFSEFDDDLTNRTVSMTLGDDRRLNKMVDELGRLRLQSGQYRSEIIRFALRKLYANQKLLAELAGNPV